MECSMESASYCCFHKAVSNNFFQQALLINIISTYANLFQHFILLAFSWWKIMKSVLYERSRLLVVVLLNIFFESLTDKVHSHLEHLKTTTLGKSHW